MRGPENMCVNDDIGLLIQGFETPPMIMMPYNPPYYARLAEAYGRRSKEIGLELVKDGVAGRDEDVNTVLLTGFYHAYGPINTYFDAGSRP